MVKTQARSGRVTCNCLHCNWHLEMFSLLYFCMQQLIALSCETQHNRIPTTAERWVRLINKSKVTVEIAQNVQGAWEELFTMDETVQKQRKDVFFFLLVSSWVWRHGEERPNRVSGSPAKVSTLKLSSLRKVTAAFPLCASLPDVMLIISVTLAFGWTDRQTDITRGGQTRVGQLVLSMMWERPAVSSTRVKCTLLKILAPVTCTRIII